MNENFFLEMLKLGKIRIEDGQIIIFNATNLLFPTRSFLYLRKVILEKLGKTKCNEILKEIGKFQIRQALVRYSKMFKVEEMTVDKFREMWIKIASLLGYGKVEFSEKKAIAKNNPIAQEYLLMFGKSPEPIDSYLCGMAEESYRALLGKPVEVKETKCIACGDPYCQFEVFPAEEKKETKT